MIYLDNAATTLHKPPQVAQAVAEGPDHHGQRRPGGPRRGPVGGPDGLTAAGRSWQSSWAAPGRTT